MKDEAKFEWGRLTVVGVVGVVERYEFRSSSTSRAAREGVGPQPRRGSNLLRPVCYHLNLDRTSKQGVIN